MFYYHSKHFCGRFISHFDFLMRSFSVNIPVVVFVHHRHWFVCVCVPSSLLQIFSVIRGRCVCASISDDSYASRNGIIFWSFCRCFTFDFGRVVDCSIVACRSQLWWVCAFAENTVAMRAPNEFIVKTIKFDEFNCTHISTLGWHTDLLVRSFYKSLPLHRIQWLRSEIPAIRRIDRVACCLLWTLYHHHDLSRSNKKVSFTSTKKNHNERERFHESGEWTNGKKKQTQN